MNNPFSFIYTNRTGSKFSAFSYQTLHHKTMRIQKIVYGKWIQFRHHFVCLIRILHFFYLVWIPEHTLSVNNRRNLLSGQ